MKTLNESTCKKINGGAVPKKIERATKSAYINEKPLHITNLKSQTNKIS
ncbi:hypothetical protein [Pseudoalteromonas sp. MSK9-3]|nr:hypothetical protein [Pseudoalteromonas sp. MSK9-3]